MHNEVVINNHKGDIIADDGVYNMKFKCLFVVFIEKYFRKYFISKMCETSQQHHFEYLFVYYTCIQGPLCVRLSWTKVLVNRDFMYIFCFFFDWNIIDSIDCHSIEDFAYNVLLITFMFSECGQINLCFTSGNFTELVFIQFDERRTIVYPHCFIASTSYFQIDAFSLCVVKQ